MVVNVIIGYAWITLGFLGLVFFSGKILFELAAAIVGISLIFKGLRILAMDRAVYNYSMHYFNNQFKK